MWPSLLRSLQVRPGLSKAKCFDLWSWFLTDLIPLLLSWPTYGVEVLKRMTIRALLVASMSEKLRQIGYVQKTKKICFSRYVK